MQVTNPAPPRNKTFDLLRGLAILGVISVHTSQAFPTGVDYADYLLGLGRFGIQLFYFVSALTMCYMWDMRNGEANQTAKFYIRRFLRIALLFWISIPVYLMVNGVDPNYWAPEGIHLHQIILTILFLHGYWPDSINSVVPGGWSIAVEMTFYLIFPFLVVNVKNRNSYLYLAIAAFFFNALIIGPLVTDFFGAANAPGDNLTQDFLYMNFFNQAPVFLAGCYLYGYINADVQISPGKIIAIFFLWISAAFTVHAYLESPSHSINFLLVVIGEFTFVRFVIRRRFEFTILEKLGRNTYAIYLSLYCY